MPTRRAARSTSSRPRCSGRRNTGCGRRRERQTEGCRLKAGGTTRHHSPQRTQLVRRSLGEGGRTQRKEAAGTRGRRRKRRSGEPQIGPSTRLGAEADRRRWTQKNEAAETRARRRSRTEALVFSWVPSSLPGLNVNNLRNLACKAGHSEESRFIGTTKNLAPLGGKSTEFDQNRRFSCCAARCFVPTSRDSA